MLFILPSYNKTETKLYGLGLCRIPTRIFKAYVSCLWSSSVFEAEIVSLSLYWYEFTREYHSGWFVFQVFCTIFKLHLKIRSHAEWKYHPSISLEIIIMNPNYTDAHFDSFRWAELEIAEEWQTLSRKIQEGTEKLLIKTKFRCHGQISRVMFFTDNCITCLKENCLLCDLLWTRWCELLMDQSDLERPLTQCFEQLFNNIKVYNVFGLCQYQPEGSPLSWEGFREQLRLLYCPVACMKGPQSAFPSWLVLPATRLPAIRHTPAKHWPMPSFWLRVCNNSLYPFTLQSVPNRHILYICRLLIRVCAVGAGGANKQCRG
jgi:hypothetical protein